MLNKATKAKLKAIGLDVDKLETAIKADDEQDFVVPEINSLTEEQLTERDANTVKTARKGIFDEGKIAGIEQANKAIGKKFNIPDDVKEFDKLVEGINKSFSKTDNEQVELLKADKLKLETDLDNERKNTKAAQSDADLISQFPTNRTGLTDREFLMLVKGSLSIEDADGTTVVKKDGQVLRDTKTQAPIAVKDAVKSWFEERKFVAAPAGGGRGGNDNPGGGGAGIKKQSQAQEQYLKDNPGGNLISPEAFNYVNNLAKADPANFEWDV